MLAPIHHAWRLGYCNSPCEGSRSAPRSSICEDLGYDCSEPKGPTQILRYRKCLEENTQRYCVNASYPFKNVVLPGADCERLVDGQIVSGTPEMEARHRWAAGERTYLDPVSGLTVFTAFAHAERGVCCGAMCRHCSYGHENVGRRGADRVDRRAKATATAGCEAAGDALSSTPGCCHRCPEGATCANGRMYVSPGWWSAGGNSVGVLVKCEMQKWMTYLMQRARIMILHLESERGLKPYMLAMQSARLTILSNCVWENCKQPCIVAVRGTII